MRCYSRREQLSQLSVHVEMASGINRALETDQLTAVGKLEQDVVFGEVTSKHILEFFTAYPDLSPEAKVGVGFRTQGRLLTLLQACFGMLFAWERCCLQEACQRKDMCTLVHYSCRPQMLSASHALLCCSAPGSRE